MEEILASNDSTTPNEDLLASLTAWNRTKWAQIRNSMFNKGINRLSLQTVESSAFVVSLDDDAYETDIYKGADLSVFGKAMLHGNGHNRWFDKSFTLCVGTNGRFGFNAEHSWYVNLLKKSEKIKSSLKCNWTLNLRTGSLMYTIF